MSIRHYLFTALALLAFVSCKEADEEEPEWANWKQRNEAYFEQQYATHSAQTASSYVLPNWGEASSKALSEVAHTQCILVDVLATGQEDDASPFYNDTVVVNYSGRLMPSASYAAGYEFDRSWLSTYDPEVDVPYQVAVNGVVDGFSTALQHMHRGDRWRVTVPYQLGYGSTDRTSIPAYSTLIFDIELVDFWSKEAGDRY